MRHALLQAAVFIVFVFLAAPIVSIAIWSLSGGAIFSFPPTGLTFKWYQSIPDAYFVALRVSLVVASITSAIAVAIGVPAALALVRGSLPMSRGLSALFLSPLMVPTLVIGVASFQFLNVLFDIFRISLIESIPGLVLAYTSFAVPFVIRSVIAGQVQFDASVEQAALNLGATPLRAFFTVTLPLLSPAVISGTIFAFLMCFDDVPVALFVGGGKSTTLPVMIINSVQFDLSPQILALCTIVTGAIIALVAIVTQLFGVDKFMGGSHG